MTKITDFLPMITCIWKISSKDYQERFWVRQELPMRGDTFSESTMTFQMDAEAVLDTSDYTVNMTDKQRKMLKQLLTSVEDYCLHQTTPHSRYGEKDSEIVADPRWHKIRDYAKKVYAEITGEQS